jgi:ring-1,2-phenylacetyl-CoA epoxidase subunit PaaD
MAHIDIQQIRSVLEQVCDPEIPVLSVTDLGIVREISVKNGEVSIEITPTYNGCPAMDMIGVNIKAALQEAGYHPVKVDLVWHPAWTTDMITESGKAKLKTYGIAPPENEIGDKMALFADQTMVPCPRCHSKNTLMVSQFGSTACKAMYRCEDCKEPFDYFKCHR